MNNLYLIFSEKSHSGKLDMVNKTENILKGLNSKYEILNIGKITIDIIKKLGFKLEDLLKIENFYRYKNHLIQKIIKLINNYEKENKIIIVDSIKEKELYLLLKGYSNSVTIWIEKKINIRYQEYEDNLEKLIKDRIWKNDLKFIKKKADITIKNKPTINLNKIYNVIKNYIA